MKKTTTTTENKATAKTAKTVAVITENKDSVSIDVMNLPADPFKDKNFCKEMANRCKNIQKEMGKIESSFEKIAFDLHYIYTKKGYEVLGCKNIYELAKDKFGIARGTAHSFISIVDRFAKRDESGNILPEIDEKYKGFKSSQLALMCSMDENQIALVTDDMSVRDMKKVLKGDGSTEEESEASDSDSSDSDSEISVEEKSVPTRQTIITFHSLEDYNRNIDNLDSLILRALTPKKDDKTKYKVEVSMVW